MSAFQMTAACYANGVNAWLGGGALGLGAAALLVFLAVWLLQRLQLVITQDMVQQSALLRFFTEHAPMDWFTSL